jgi:multidrug efflux pump subunit AcrA (membrane-fusion protein)
VVEIGKAVNQDTAAFRVDIIAENPDRTLKPGMFARVDIVTDRRRDAVSIAKDFLVRRNNRDVVFVVEKSEDQDYEIAREVPVELGLSGREEIEVTWGLKEGDIVVIRGFEVLQDKTPVSVLRADEPAKPAEVPEDKKEEDKPKDATAEEKTESVG